ncbi:MAG: hypothetical protein NBV77_07030 [Bacteroidia bacterium]|nr:hypothetical protein [Bacteroidia bacterium]
MIDLIHQQLNENQQIDIFTAKILALKISLWGGKMSLSGVRNPGPNNHWLVNPNFDWNIYLQLIDSVKNMDFINPGFQFMIETMNHIPKFGPAFLTKHLHFLTHGNAPQQQLPIYDSIIAENWFNIPNVKFTDYLDYFNWVREKSIHFGISIHEFERFLFNHA